MNNIENLKELIHEESIRDSQTPLLRNGEIIRSGVIKITPEGYVEEVDINGMTYKICSIKEFFKGLKLNSHIKSNFLLVKDKVINQTLICNLNNKRISAILEFDTELFSPLDRMVQYLILNEIKHVYLTQDGVYTKQSEDSNLIKNLDLNIYNKEKVIQNLTNYAIKQAEITREPNQNGTEVSLSVQGNHVTLVSWRDLTGGSELSLSLDDHQEATGEVEDLFKSECGFILASRILTKNIQTLVKDSHNKRVAFIGISPSSYQEPQVISSYFSEDVNIEDLRSRDYDVYVINLERMKDHRSLFTLPSNKLCILILDFYDIEKALRMFRTLVEDNVVWTQLTSSLLGVVTNLDKDGYVVLTSQSRELLSYETDILQVINKIKEPFIIRDKVDLSAPINIEEEIKLIFQKANEVNAINISICPGSPIRLHRTKFDYDEYSSIKVTPNFVDMLLLNMVTAKQIAEIYREGELDTSYSLPDIGRYRLGVARQRSSLMVSIRKVPFEIPDPRLLNLPLDFLEDAIIPNKGLTLIVGSPGSGKTLTFNCLIDKINREKGGIIFLMGSPIEFIHSHKKGLVVQVEIGKDLPSYSKGIAKSLRMYTSTLGFEELRTQEEFSSLGMLLNSPNSTYLTLHSESSVKGLEIVVKRLSETGISMEKAQEDVANALNYVIFQELIDYNGEIVLIYELIKATHIIKNVIREGNFSQLNNLIHSEEGCRSLDRVILDRLERGMLDYSSVKNHVKDKKLFEAHNFK